MKFQPHEIQVIGSRVLVKQYLNDKREHFNWVEIARFSFQKRVCSDPNQEAKDYAARIIG
jgi:hypothetical protein